METLPVGIKKAVEKVRGRHLLEHQEAFLATYLNNGFNARDAATTVGIKSTAHSYYIKSLRKEIIEILEIALIEQGGSAISTIANILSSEKETRNANTKLEAAKTVLDRIGLPKQERVEHTLAGDVGLFILPAKKI
jgi:hypothetical protein